MREKMCERRAEQGTPTDDEQFAKSAVTRFWMR